MHMVRTAIILLLELTSLFQCHKIFQSRIPNGDRVTNPCDHSIWEGVGHENKHGGGPRNQFGKDFETEKYRWSEKLCRLDSDGDGKTNGEELGDPHCIWTEGGKPDRDIDITHPGICDPLSSSVCTSQKFVCPDTWNCPAINKTDVKSLRLTLPVGTKVPAQETTYLCYNRRIPSDRLYDIIASQPVIVNKNVMHHMTMYGCEGDLHSSKEGTIDNCELREQYCNKMLFIWSVGMDGFCQPENRGRRIGKGLTTWVSIQYHWNNVERNINYTDSSGVEIFYTPILRQFAEDMFQTGEMTIFIPPHKKEHVVTGVCSEECSKRSFEKAFNITSILLHMHKFGTRMWAKHYRKGQLLRLIAEDRHYTYDRPVVHRFDDNPIVFEPGDEIKVECTFSSNSNDWTIFGPGTSDEMCLTLISYYPANEFKVENCFSLDGRCYQDGVDCDVSPLMDRVKREKVNLFRYCDVFNGRICSNICRGLIDSIKADHSKCFYQSTVNLSRIIWSTIIRNKLPAPDDVYILKAFKGCELGQ